MKGMTEKFLRGEVSSAAGRALLIRAADAYFDAVAEQTRLEMKISRWRDKASRLEKRLPELRLAVQRRGRELQFAAIGCRPENISMEKEAS